MCNRLACAAQSLGMRHFHNTILLPNKHSSRVCSVSRDMGNVFTDSRSLLFPVTARQCLSLLLPPRPHACRQQLSAMQDRWNDLEADAAAAREAAEEARIAAAKADADLAALSTAYNDLEEHAFKLEEQLKQLEQAADSQQQQQAGAAFGGVPEAEVQERIKAALEQVGLAVV